MFFIRNKRTAPEMRVSWPFSPAFRSRRSAAPVAGGRCVSRGICLVSQLVRVRRRSVDAPSGRRCWRTPVTAGRRPG